MVPHNEISHREIQGLQGGCKGPPQQLCKDMVEKQLAFYLTYNKRFQLKTGTPMPTTLNCQPCMCIRAIFTLITSITMITILTFITITIVSIVTTNTITTMTKPYTLDRVSNCGSAQGKTPMPGGGCYQPWGLGF